MDKKNKFLTAISIGCATVWFSTHCGAGFASGTQELQYFANHGWFGVFMPIITFIIIAVTYYVGLETARQTDKWGYEGWSKEAYGGASKFLTPAMDLSIVITTIAATAASIATGGVLGNQYLNLPIWVGSAFMFVAITLLVIFGENIVRKNAMIMTSVILIIILIVMVAGLIKFAPDIARLMGEHYVNPASSKFSIKGTDETVEGSLGNAILWALAYAGFQVGAIGGITASFKGAKSKAEAKGAMTLGCILNIFMLVGICLLIFSGMPEIYTDEQARLLPTVFIVNQLDIPALGVLYPLLLFLALITTGVGFVFGILTRIEPYVLNNMENKVAKKAIISVAVLIVCFMISKLGLMFVIKVAYKYLGIFNWLFIILPLWTLGFKNIKRRDRLSATEASDNMNA